MPRYALTDSETGDTLTIEADSEPSQDDVQEIFSRHRPANLLQSISTAESLTPKPETQEEFLSRFASEQGIERLKAESVPELATEVGKSLFDREEPGSASLASSPLVEAGITPENVPSGKQISKFMPGRELESMLASSAAKTAVGIADWASSPKGIAQLGAFAVPGLDVVMSAKFIHDMAKGGYLNLQDAKDAYDKKDWQRLSDNLLGATANFFFAYKLGKHTGGKLQEYGQKLDNLRAAEPPTIAPPIISAESTETATPQAAEVTPPVGEKPPPVEPVETQPLTKGEADASSIETPAAVHGDLQSSTVEGKEQVPIKESGAGIQPQTEGGIPPEEARPPVPEVLLKPGKYKVEQEGKTVTFTDSKTGNTIKASIVRAPGESGTGSFIARLDTTTPTRIGGESASGPFTQSFEQAQGHLKGMLEQRGFSGVQASKVTKPTLAYNDGWKEGYLEKQRGYDPEVHAENERFIQKITTAGNEAMKQHAEQRQPQAFGGGPPEFGQWVSSDDISKLPKLIRDYGDFWLILKWERSPRQPILASELAKNYDKIITGKEAAGDYLREVFVKDKPFESTSPSRPDIFPKPGSELQMAIVPGAKEFIEQDVIPAATTAAKALVETGRGLQNLLAPPTKGELAQKAAGIVRERSAELAQKDVQARKAFGEARSTFARFTKPMVLDWTDAVESGATSKLNPNLKSVADNARAALDQRLKDVQGLGTGKLQHFIQDYFPHMWKQPDAVMDWLSRIFGRRPLRGPASFLKKRSIPTTRDGVNAGFEPVSWNPIDILLAKVHEMDRYVMGQKIFNEFKDQGLARFSKSGGPLPGEVQINDSIANVIQYKPTVKADGTPGPPERVIRGHYYAPEDAGRILNNFLSPGLGRFAWYRALRWVGNNLNLATLGLSGYHLTFTMVDSGTSKLSLGIEQATQGKLKGIPTMIRGLAGTPGVNQLEAYFKGNKVLQEYTKPGSVGGEMAQIVDGLIAGGGRVEMPQIYQNSTLGNFFDAIRSGNYPGAILRAPFAAIHAVSYPLMNVVVPRLKLGVFSDMARHEIERMGPSATREEFRANMGKIWDSVDNRMGELVYDNLFWNKTLKDLSFLGIRSVGWNLGTIRELGGAAVDTAKIIGRIKRGEPVVTRKMAYAVALPMTVGLMGALYMKLRTGQSPQEPKDYFYPKTGNKLPNGEDERVNFPSYLKDIESFKRHPGTTVIHKLHPMWGSIYDMLQNKDFYGTEIVHPDDPLMSKIGQEAQFIVKQFRPYSAQGAQKRGESQEGIEPKVESFFGIMPMPAELTRTPAENLAIELMRKQLPQGSRTQAQFDRMQNERKAVAQIQRGKMTIDDAVDKGLVEESRWQTVQDRADSEYLPYAIKHLDAIAAMKVFEKANPKERESIVDEVWGKIVRSKTLSDEDRALLESRFEKLDAP